MAVTTRSMSLKTRASTKPPRSTSCTCEWCRTWKPRKVYRKRRTVKKEEPLPASTPAKSKSKPIHRAKVTAASALTPATGSVDSVALTELASLSIASPSIATTPSGDYMDASLVMVNLAHNTDKFYILQLIQASTTMFGAPTYYFFTRWGRTGMDGQHQLDGPFTTLAEAQALFESKFHDKTGQDWSDRASFSQVDGKYDLLRVDYGANANGQWEYYMDNFVDGKATGWYPYTAEGTTQTELLWQTHQANSAYNRRIVQSGYYSYCIDLDAMTQTNIRTNKTRRIRRR